MQNDFNANHQDADNKQITTIECSRSDSASDDSGDFEEALDMSWPDTCSKRIIYLLLAPIMVPLWILIPDVRKPVCCCLIFVNYSCQIFSCIS